MKTFSQVVLSRIVDNTQVSTVFILQVWASQIFHPLIVLVNLFSGVAVVLCLVPVLRPLLLLVQFLFYWGKHQFWFFSTFLHVLRVRVIFWSDSTSGLNWWHLLCHSFAHSANTSWRCRNSFRIWEIRKVSLKRFSEEGKRVLTRIIWRSGSW